MSFRIINSAWVSYQMPLSLAFVCISNNVQYTEQKSREKEEKFPRRMEFR
jgi:hypothetical protein